MALGYWETLVSAQVDGTAVTAAAATSLIPPAAKKLLAANYFDVIGKQMLVKASGRISSVITTPGTARFDFRIGGVVFDSLAILLDTVAAHVTVGWDLEILLTCRSIGTAGTLFGQGRWTCDDLLGRPVGTPMGVLSAILPWNTAPAVGTAFDTTVAGVMDLFFTQTVATGSCTLHQYSVIGMN